MTRRTFVIQVHADGISTLENVSTLERVVVRDLSDIGPCVEAWLAEAPAEPAGVEPDDAGVER